MTKAEKAAKEKEPAETPECFVIMPLADVKDYRPGHFDQVYESIIAPACQRAGYKPKRANDTKGSDVIHLTILQQLLNAPMVLCDLSTRNPNVLFELGLRIAFNKPVVIIQEKGTARIFDTDIIRHYDYCPELRYLDVLKAQDQLWEAIKETKSEQNTYNKLLMNLGIDAAKTPEFTDEQAKEAKLDLIVNRVEALTFAFTGLSNASSKQHIKNNTFVSHNETNCKYDKELFILNEDYLTTHFLDIIKARIRKYTMEHSKSSKKDSKQDIHEYIYSNLKVLNKESSIYKVLELMLKAVSEDNTDFLNALMNSSNSDLLYHCG